MKKINLIQRVLDISYKFHTGHIGSCITCLPILDEIYQMRKTDDPVILSNGHAGLALYVILEKYETFLNAEVLFKKHGVHPNRDSIDQIWCSTGSLGQGLPIGVGMALADPNKTVYVVCSDGELAEGSCFEALRIANDLKLANLVVYVNCNGYSAYKNTDFSYLVHQYSAFSHLRLIFQQTDCAQFPFFEGLEGHYHPLTEEEYAQATKILISLT